MRFVDEAVITAVKNLYHLVAQMVVMADVVEVSIFKQMMIQVP